jgi:hypothetical protein
VPDVVWDDEGEDVVWDAPDVSGLESAGRGAAQAGTFGFADEIAGGVEALYDVATTDKTLSDLPDLYRQHRDESRANFAAAEEANPTEFTAGQIGGAALTAFLPGGAPATLGRAVAVGAGMGAAQGLGESEADLTRGEFGEAATDAALGGALGGAAGGIGHGIAKGVGAVANKVRGRAQQGAADAVAEEEAKQALKQAQREASALGKYRSSVQSASRDLEVLGRESADLPDDTLRRAAQEMLDSPEGVAVRRQVVEGKLGTAPERLDEMAQLRAEHGALVAGREGLVKQATQDALADPIRRQFAPRLATLGHRLVPAALAGAGGMIGGPEGAAVGAGLGGVMALTQGRPGIILRNLVRSPASRKWLWDKAASIATVSPQALGRFGLSLARILQSQGPEMAEAAHEVLMAEDDEYGALLLQQVAPEVQ